METSKILHYKKILGSGDQHEIKKCLKKLSTRSLTAEQIKSTGIGKAVNNLRHDEELGTFARQMVADWKKVVESAIPPLPAADLAIKSDDQTATSQQPPQRLPTLTIRPSTKLVVKNHHDNGYTVEPTAFTSDSGSFESILGLCDSSGKRLAKAKPTGSGIDSVKKDSSGTSSGIGKLKIRTKPAAEPSVKRKTFELVSSGGETSPVPPPIRELTKPPEELKKKPKNFQLDATDILAPLLDSPTVNSSYFDGLNPNYRPSRLPNMAEVEAKHLSGGPSGAQHSSDDDDTNFTAKQRQKIVIYKGKKRSDGRTVKQVSTLYDMCIKILGENIDAIEQTGGIPFEILRPVLEKSTPTQLYKIEDFNPYLLENTDCLWEKFLRKEFKDTEREENETYRDAYFRAIEQRETRLNDLSKNLTAQVKAASDSTRKAKLVYKDVVAKPPRDVRRQQIKHGTGRTDVVNASTLVQHRRMIDESFTVKPNGSTSVSGTSKRAARGDTDQVVPSAKKAKPRVAPMMMKSMKMMKSARHAR